MRRIYRAVLILLPLVALRAQVPIEKASSSGVDLKAIDLTVEPCQDFYQYACGNWIRQNPIPADEGSWSRFDELHQRIQTTLRQILEDSEKHQSRSATDQKIGAFYASCMNEAAIEQKGITPLAPELTRIEKISTPQEFVAEIARLHDRQVDVLFSFGSEPDPKDARMMLAELDQGGIGLPERDYYFRTDAQSEDLRKKYVVHIAKTFELIGVPAVDAAKDAATVMSIEIALAKASMDVTSRRNPELLVNEMSDAELAGMSPRFDFTQFFADLKTPEFQKLNVNVPQFIKGLNALLEAQSYDNLKLYLKWRYLSASATLLTKAFIDENFDFYGRTLSGETQVRPRWKRCTGTSDDELGDALGRKFVDETFGKEGKDRTLTMVQGIERSMAEDIQSLSWMSSETKQKALQKLSAVTNKIGYPDKWRDYSSVNIADDDYFGNWYRANEYESRRNRSKIGKPVDRSEWSMTPPTVNAYYDPAQNNINFPAGILQPPFYSNQAGDAVNYGAIGVVIGHELTHAFDDEGRKYDADGNLKDWWQPQDAKRFEQLSGCLANEYGSFTVLPKLHVNGQLTLGENTADNGGLRLAYHAIMADLASKSVPETKKKDGYTNAQQFFLGFGQIWCASMRPQTLRELVQTDPHSPPQFRVNGAIVNSPDFSAAFGCKAGDKMYAAQSCRIW
ncbi:MAG TPA: M13 family metallopeptidase [Bryobacteraceae bacterium]|nr:M13 family metallopeptidase [Bryobacteraceae bacterium]